MPNLRLSYLMMSLMLVASFAMGCRAPYPTYNPYGFYGQPCVNPPATGGYNPTGRVDPYYGAPTNGVYPQNPYATPNQYPGYPPVQQPVGSTSQRTWNSSTSNGGSNGPTVEPTNPAAGSLITSTDGEWHSVENPNPSPVENPVARTAMLDTQATDSGNGSSSGPPTNDMARFDGFGRN